MNEKSLDNRLLALSNAYDRFIAQAEKLWRMPGLKCPKCKSSEDTYLSFNLDNMDRTWYPNLRGKRVEKLVLLQICNYCGTERYVRNNPNAKDEK